MSCHNIQCRKSTALQTVVLSSTLRRTLEGCPTAQQGISVEERSVRSAIEVFYEKMKQDGILTNREEEAMQIIADCALALEAKLGGKPEVVIWVDEDPNVCYARVGKRDQPDDESIQLSELRAIDLLHRSMIKGLQQAGTTVVTMDSVVQSQKTRQLAELTSFLESRANGIPSVGRPVFISIQEPVKFKAHLRYR